MCADHHSETGYRHFTDLWVLLKYSITDMFGIFQAVSMKNMQFHAGGICFTQIMQNTL